MKLKPIQLRQLAYLLRFLKIPYSWNRSDLFINLIHFGTFAAGCYQLRFKDDYIIIKLVSSSYPVLEFHLLARPPNYERVIRVMFQMIGKEKSLTRRLSNSFIICKNNKMKL